MTRLNIPLPRSEVQAAGYLLAGFVRAVDAEMARLALADRGHDMDSVLQFNDRQMLLEFGSSAAATTGNPQPLCPPQGALDCHWLLVPVDDDNLTIVAEYLSACGAEQIGCKFRSSEAIMQARCALIQRLGERCALAVEKFDHVAALVPEFHPVSWHSWTHGSRGARND